jgi:hypothetical protein
MAMFYAVQFIVRPFRLFGVVYRFLKRQPVTILDGLLHGKFHADHTVTAVIQADS